MKLTKILIITTCFVIFNSLPVFGATLEAKNDGTKVFSTASNKGDVVATLKKGDTLEGKERKGMYWEVKTADGKDGFVSVISVNTKLEGDGSISKALRNAVKESRSEDEAANARSRSAVMGVRGLAADNETAAVGDAKPNMRMVYAMEDINISQAKINKLQEKINEEIENRVNKKQSTK